MGDLSLMVALGSIIVAGLAIVGFWINFSDRISRAQAAADAAAANALEAKRLVDEAHTRITALAAEFGMYRERVALEFVGKGELRDLRLEVVGAIKELDGKIDELLKQERDRLHERHAR